MDMQSVLFMPRMFRSARFALSGDDDGLRHNVVKRGDLPPQHAAHQRVLVALCTELLRVVGGDEQRLPVGHDDVSPEVNSGLGATKPLAHDGKDNSQISRSASIIAPRVTSS